MIGFRECSLWNRRHRHCASDLELGRHYPNCGASRRRWAFLRTAYERLWVLLAIFPPAGILQKARRLKRLWSATEKLSSTKNALKHWVLHGADFPDLQNAKQYVEKAKNFVNKPPSGTLTKTWANGDIVFYNPASNTFAVKTADGAPRTMFKPDPAIHQYPTRAMSINDTNGQAQVVSEHGSREHPSTRQTREPACETGARESLVVRRRPLELPPLSSWSDLSKLFLTEHRIQIKIGEKLATANYAEIGLEDRRDPQKTSPRSAWDSTRSLNRGVSPAQTNRGPR